MIRQGEVFWVDLGEASKSGPGFRHPHVVVQNEVFNRSRLSTVVVCTLTSNLKRAQVPGNVLLEEGEANLPKPGALSAERIRQILDGIYLLLEPQDLEE